MREERDVSHHLMIGPLILFCTLNHFIQHQHTVVHLANRKEEKERDMTRGWERREQEGGDSVLDNFIQAHQHTIVHLANRREQGERHDKEKGEDKGREQEGGGSVH